jgi:hypothetical protein
MRAFPTMRLSCLQENFGRCTSFRRRGDGPETPGATLSAATPPTSSLAAPRGRSMITPTRMTTTNGRTVMGRLWPTASACWPSPVAELARGSGQVNRDGGSSMRPDDGEAEEGSRQHCFWSATVLRCTSAAATWSKSTEEVGKQRKRR